MATMSWGSASGDNESLFFKRVSVSLKGSSVPLSRSAELVVSVESRFSALFRKELVIKISDDSDPFLVYLLTISEDDFLSLRSSQGLLVDFSSFPQHFVGLLNCCSEEQHKQNPKYLLTLSVDGRELRSSARLDIIETNPFKHLTHLSLKFNSLDEISFRKYLLTNFQSLKNEKDKLQQSAQYLQSDYSEQLRKMGEELVQKNRDIDKLKIECEFSFRESERQLKSEIEKLHAKDLEKESLIQELYRKLRISEEKEALVSRRLEEVTRERSNNNVLFEDSERTLNQLMAKVSSLEDGLKEKDLLIRKVQESYQKEFEERKRSERLSDVCETRLKEAETRAEQLDGDLLKANEIIRKLQSEMQRNHSKLDVLNLVANKQDGIVSDREGRVKRLEQDLKLCLERMKKKDMDQERLRDQMTSLKEKWEESQKQIKTNENVITWLNKQLSELQPNQGLANKGNAGPSHKHDTLVTRSKSTSDSRDAGHGLPPVNLVDKHRDGVTVRGFKTDPKSVYQRNPLFVSRGPRVADPFKCTKVVN